MSSGTAKSTVSVVGVENYINGQTYNAFDVVKKSYSNQNYYFVSAKDNNSSPLPSEPDFFSNENWKTFGDYKNFDIGTLWQPSHVAMGDIKTSDEEAVSYNFADGYKQVVGRGLNFSNVSLKGTFHLGFKEVKALMAMFDYLKGNIPFKFREGTGTSKTRTFLCTAFSCSFIGEDSFELEAEFKEYIGDYEKVLKIIYDTYYNWPTPMPPSPPTITPNGGTFGDCNNPNGAPIAVTISTAAGNELWYSVGSAPAIKAPFTSVSVTISEPVIVAAYNQGEFYKSEVAYAVFEAFNLGNLPTPSIGYEGEGTERRVFVKVTGDPIEDSTLRYKFYKKGDAVPNWSNWVPDAGEQYLTVSVEPNSEYVIEASLSKVCFNDSFSYAEFRTSSLKLNLRGSIQRGRGNGLGVPAYIRASVDVRDAVLRWGWPTWQVPHIPRPEPPFKGTSKGGWMASHDGFNFFSDPYPYYVSGGDKVFWIEASKSGYDTELIRVDAVEIGNSTVPDKGIEIVVQADTR